jgi:methylglutaconyl-CoA hydratase
LNQHLEQLAQNEQVKILILRGQGDHFCAGADAQWMQKIETYSLSQNQDDALKFANLMHNLFNFPTPVICFVHGVVYGGGIGLVACSDIVIASDNAQFFFSEVKLGLVPSVISPYIIAAIGSRPAKRYMLTAEIFNATTAKNLGLVHEISEVMIANLSQVENILQSWIETLQKNGPKALMKCKELFKHFNSNPKFGEEALTYTANLIAERRVSKEGQEGLKAFLEKRKPSWQTKRTKK